MAGKDKIELNEVIDALKASCEDYGARTAEISFATPDGWRVSIRVENEMSNT